LMRKTNILKLSHYSENKKLGFAKTNSKN